MQTNRSLALTVQDQEPPGWSPPALGFLSKSIRTVQATVKVTVVPIRVYQGQKTCCFQTVLMRIMAIKETDMPIRTGTGLPFFVKRASTSPPNIAPLVRPVNV